jgi:CBS domain-containing protein
MNADSNRRTTSIEDLFSHVKTKMIMRTPVTTVYETDNFSKAQVKFINDAVSHIMVLNKNDQLVGLLSQKYLYKAHSPRKIISPDLQYDPTMIMDGDSFYTKEALDSYILSHVMKKDPFVMGPEDSVVDVVINMKRKNIACIPIVDHNYSVLGVITDREIVKFFGDLLAGE